jgi:hypothetical protein
MGSEGLCEAVGSTELRGCDSQGKIWARQLQREEQIPRPCVRSRREPGLEDRGAQETNANLEEEGMASLVRSGGH